MTLGTLDAASSPLSSPGPAGTGQACHTRLAGRPVVLVGMMGAGKTMVGKRLASRLGLPFIDSDHEIEDAAQMTIAEIFARHGEAYFRDREEKVIARLVGEGPRVVATGGGSFIHPATRALLKRQCVTVWLRAEFDVLMRRVRKRQNRPLLKTPDPEGTMRRLIDARYPVYAEADLIVDSRDVPHDHVVDAVLGAIASLGGEDPVPDTPASRPEVTGHSP